MNKSKLEGNILIAISSMKKIMDVFLGPFLTAYFIKTSKESFTNLSVYYIFSYIILVIGFFIVGLIVKNKFKVGMFRIGVIINFFYILSIVILKDKIIDNLPFIAILNGLASACYWFPSNSFLVTKIDNKTRTQYMMIYQIVNSIVGVICPLLLASIITATNYELTAIVIAFVSIVQIVLSFILLPDKENKLPKFNVKNAFKKFKTSPQVKKMLFIEFFMGMNIANGSIGTIITVLIFNSFKTNMNLGIITSITTVLSIILVIVYGKVYKNKNDKNIVVVSSFVPLLLLPLIFFSNNITLIIYNICYTLFTTLLTLTRDIRFLNISNSSLVGKEHRSEFISIREGFLNAGRIFSFILLLIVGLTASDLLLNIVFVFLTISIFITGLLIRRLERFDNDE